MAVMKSQAELRAEEAVRQAERSVRWARWALVFSVLGAVLQIAVVVIKVVARS